MTYRTPSGDLHVGKDAPSGSEPLGILYPRAGTLGGCSAHNAMMSVELILPIEADSGSSYEVFNVVELTSLLHVARFTPTRTIGNTLPV